MLILNLVSIFIQNKINEIITRSSKSFTILTKTELQYGTSKMHHSDPSVANNTALINPFSQITLQRTDSSAFIFAFQVHGGPKGDVCLGKLKCHHYICISCFSDVKFHSKCQICHKSFKKNDIKFEYLSPNSN